MKRKNLPFLRTGLSAMLYFPEGSPGWCLGVHLPPWLWAGFPAVTEGHWRVPVPMVLDLFVTILQLVPIPFTSAHLLWFDV